MKVSTLERTPAVSHVPADTGKVQEHPIKIAVTGLSFFYGDKKALENISIELRANQVTAFIGPSGCGKSTFLRTLNRMNDVIVGTRVEGEVSIGGRNVYGPDVDVVAWRGCPMSPPSSGSAGSSKSIGRRPFSPAHTKSSPKTT